MSAERRTIRRTDGGWPLLTRVTAAGPARARRGCCAGSPTCPRRATRPDSRGRSVRGGRRRRRAARAASRARTGPAAPSACRACAGSSRSRRASPSPTRGRAAGDARRLQVADEVADPPGPGRGEVRARQQDAPARELRVARPDLLAGHDPAVAAALGTGAERGQVGARAGLGEELAPELVRGEDLREEAPLLFLRSVGDERRPDQVDADPVDDLGCAGGGELLLEDVVLDHRGAAPAVLARPVDADPAAVVQLPLPGAEEGDLVGEGRVLRRGRPIRAEPRAQLGAAGLLGGAEREIHYTTLRARRLASSSAPTPTSASTAAVSAPSAAAGR